MPIVWLEPHYKVFSQFLVIELNHRVDVFLLQTEMWNRTTYSL